MVLNTHAPSNTCKFSFNTIIITHINENWDSLTLFCRMGFDTWQVGCSCGGGGDEDDDDDIAYIYYSMICVCVCV